MEQGGVGSQPQSVIWLMYAVSNGVLTGEGSSEGLCRKHHRIICLRL